MPGNLGKLREELRQIVNHRYFIPICLGSGFVLRFLWICLVNAPQVSDFAWYYGWGLTISSGKGYSVNGIPTAYWPVGYPGFLGVLFSIVGPSVFIAKLANILFYMGTILLTYSFSNRILHSDFAARITLLILSFYPNQIAYTSLLSTEIFFIFLLMLGAVLFVFARGRVGFLLLAGLCWGLATLTKTQAIVIPLIFCFVFFAGAKNLLKSVGLIYVAVLIVLAPWISRNYSLFGKPLLSTNGGIVLFMGNNPYSTGNQLFRGNKAKSLLGDLGTDGEMFDGKEVQREARARDVAINYIEHNPGQAVLLWPKKLRALYLTDVDGIYYSLGMVQVPWDKIKLLYFGLRVAAQSYYGVILALFLVSLPTVLSSTSWPQRIGLLIIIYLTLIYLVFCANPRYHFALMPWIAIYSGIGGDMLIKRVRVLPSAAERGWSQSKLLTDSGG